MINWKTTKSDFDLICKITDRAMFVAEKSGIALNRRSLMMDLTAVHCNGNTLNLTELLSAPDFDFTHDVFGIMRHVDRSTGRLRDCFVPRLSRRSEVAK